jgi:hypothetical protein
MRVSRARGPSKPQRAVQHRLEDPAPHPPCLLRRSSGPFTKVFNLPFGSGICSRSRLKGSPAHVSALAGTSTGSLSGQLCEHRPGGGPALRHSLSCCLSAAGIRFLGTLSRQRGSAPLTIGLPPRLRIPVPARRTLARFTRSARMRPRPAGRSLYPGDSGAHRPSRNPRPSPAASQRRSLPPRRHNPARDVKVARHHQEFPGSRPTVLSPHLWPP